MVQFLDSANAVRTIISPTLDLFNFGTTTASTCAGALTPVAVFGSALTYSRIKVHAKFLKSSVKGSLQFRCTIYSGQFQIRIGDKSFNNLKTGINYLTLILDKGFHDLYIDGYAMTGQTRPNFMCSINGTCLTSTELFNPQRSAQVAMPRRVNMRPHETLFNLTSVYFNPSTDEYCIPALKVSSDLTTPCITLGDNIKGFTKPLISLYGLEFNGTIQALPTIAHKVFQTDRLWSYMFELYIFDMKNKQTIFSRYTNNFNEEYLLLTGLKSGWNWIFAFSDVGGNGTQQMWAQSLDERGNYFENKRKIINYRLQDQQTHFNIYGSTLDFKSPFAGIFRFIQLENDWVLSFDEMRTYFTSNCLGKCGNCRIDIQGQVPTAFPPDTRGTCFEEFGGQDFINFNFTNTHDIGIAGSMSEQTAKVTTMQGRMLYNQYDFLFGRDGSNQTEYPQKIGFQGLYFNGSSILQTKEYIKFPQTFTIEIWFKFTENNPTANSTKEFFSLLKLFTPAFMSQAVPYFELSFLNRRNDMNIQLQGRNRQYGTGLNTLSSQKNRWQFVGLSVMNLNKNTVKMCFEFPNMISDCSIRFSGMFFDSGLDYKIMLGDGFRGIIRTLKILNWPKLDIHFKSSYLEYPECKSFDGIKECDLCSPSFDGGTCFPNCELDESPSTQYVECQKCQPTTFCNHCDDSVAPWFCSKCKEGSFMGGSEGCIPCHERCRTCRRERDYDCVTCFPGFELYLGACVEICGDGKDFQENECEDGNLINGDGCSSACKIEEYYYCIGGTVNNTDTCGLRAFSNLTISDDLSTLTVMFSKAMTFKQPLTSKDFQVQALVDDSTLEISDLELITDTAGVSFKKIQFDISYSDSTYLQSTKSLRLFYNMTFLKKASILDQNQISVYNSSVWTYKTIKSMEFFTEDESLKSAQSLVFSGIAANIALVIVLQQGMDLMFGLINFMQLISLIPLMGFNLPSHTRAVFKIVAFSNMDMGLFRSMYLTFYDVERLDENSRPFNDNYNEYDIFSLIFPFILSLLNSFKL